MKTGINTDQGTVTKDGFLDNSFYVLQPRGNGHRAGLDAVLLAACVDSATTIRLADLGAGCGVAGMAVATRLPDAVVDLVERDAGMVQLAHRTIKLPENAALAPRLQVVKADVTARGAAREKAGLVSNRYDHIIANPPYNPPALQPSPDEARAAAHCAPPSLEPWFKTAASSLRANGLITFILRPEALANLAQLVGSRFGTLRIRPLHPRRNKPASRILVRATKGTKAPLELLPPLVLHEPDGTWRGEIEAVLRGQAGIAL